MRSLDTITESIRLGHAHPTTLLNAFIELENEGGLVAVRRMERQLQLGVRAMRERGHPHSDLAQKWLNSARAYLITRAEQRQAS